MTITTKYGIGDELWVISKSNIEESPTITRHRWSVNDKGMVSCRRVCDDGIGLDVDYWLNCGDCYKWAEEDICFATRAAAQAECDRRNEA